MKRRPKYSKGKSHAILVNFGKDETLYDSFEKGKIKYKMSGSDYARRLIAIGMDVVENDPLRLLSHCDPRFTAYEMTKE
jgi:hypothetical protein